MRGVRIGESPDWLKEVLEASGVRPLTNIVDITNFVLLELGQPLHAFDLDKLAGGAIIVRRAAAGERLTTLDGIERKLCPDDLLIADAEQATGEDPVHDHDLFKRLFWTMAAFYRRPRRRISRP